MSNSPGKRSKASSKIVVKKGERAGLHSSGETRIPQKPVTYRTQYYTYYLACAVSLVTFVVYLTSLRNGFVSWDDSYYVLLNSHIRSFNLHFLRWAFFDFYAGNWHPLTWISHAMDYAVYGLNPLGHHLTSNIFHAVNTFMVVVLTTRLVNMRTRAAAGFPDGKAALVAGAVTGLLFGIHPLHVESVAWVAERKDLLCALFFFLSISSYLEHVDHAVENRLQGRATSFFSSKNYLFAVGFFVLALLSKPMAITLPFVLLILEWYPLGRIQSPGSLRDAVIEKLPFFGLALISSILTILAQSSSGAVGNAPLSVRVFVASGSLIAYLWKMIVPVNLLPFYPFPMPDTFSYSDYYPAVVLVIGVTAACLVLARKSRIWTAAWCYYVITLLPVLGLVQVGRQAMADRYTYLPSLAPFLLIGLGAAWFFAKANTLKQGGRAVKAVGIAAALFVLISLSYLTFKQIGIWKDGFALWNWQIEKEPEKVSMAYMNRGLMFSMQKGRPDEAIADFDQAIVLDPSNYEAYRQRALLYEKKGETDKAIADFEKALALSPPYDEAYKDPTYIETHVRPYIETHIILGVLYGRAGSFDKAIEHLTSAIRLEPGSALSYDDRGYTYFISGKYDKALEDFNKAIELNKTYANAYINRGNLYLKRGNNTRAVDDFRKACVLGNEGSCSTLKALLKGSK